VGVPEAHRAIDAVWRLESARIIAGLARLVNDVGLAEELAQDALVAALKQWPESGIPPNPGAWLMATARHQAIDRIRRNERLARKLEQLGHEFRQRQESAVFDGPADLAAVVQDEGVQDDLLRMMFIACHPVLSTEARVALTLRLLGGLTTEEIARGFLSSEATIAQRIMRAKRTLASKQIPFEAPPADERAPRLASVLEVIYLIFNEGYTATAGDDWFRPELCYEALRLGRMLAELSPAEPEVHGLAALMEIQASRMRARLSPAGEPIPLLEQNRGSWDQLLIRRGFTALLRAERLGRPPGPYMVQAAIAAMPGPAAPRRPTGNASRRSTRCWPSSRRPPSWNSTARSPSPWPPGRPRASSSSTRWRRSRNSAITTSCRVSAGTSSPGSAATRRHAPSSSAPPRSPVTRASERCSSTAPPRAGAGQTRMPTCLARSGPQNTGPASAAGRDARFLATRTEMSPTVRQHITASCPATTSCGSPCERASSDRCRILPA
jgi:RNA polymerase sigma factor (sigma-70 family)